jgi:hypothetical protein
MAANFDYYLVLRFNETELLNTPQSKRNIQVVGTQFEPYVRKVPN